MKMISIIKVYLLFAWSEKMESLVDCLHVNHIRAGEETRETQKIKAGRLVESDNYMQLQLFTTPLFLLSFHLLTN